MPRSVAQDTFRVKVEPIGSSLEAHRNLLEPTGTDRHVGTSVVDLNELMSLLFVAFRWVESAWDGLVFFFFF